MSTPRMLAVAVIRHRPGTTEGTEQSLRRAIASYADAHGYAVTEIFETAGPWTMTEATVDRMLTLAERMDAKAVLTLGKIEEQTLHTIAERSSMDILPVPYPSTRHTTTSGDEPRPPWTGRLDFDLRTRTDSSGIILETDIRPDHLALAYKNRTLATINRHRFRQWLDHDHVELRAGEITWTWEDPHPHISIDGRTDYLIPPGTIRQFLAII